jgi:hypothetical protein
VLGKKMVVPLFLVAYPPEHVAIVRVPLPLRQPTIHLALGDLVALGLDKPSAKQFVHLCPVVPCSMGH